MKGPSGVFSFRVLWLLAFIGFGFFTIRNISFGGEIITMEEGERLEGDYDDEIAQMGMDGGSSGFYNGECYSKPEASFFSGKEIITSESVGGVRGWNYADEDKHLDDDYYFYDGKNWIQPKDVDKAAVRNKRSLHGTCALLESRVNVILGGRAVTKREWKDTIREVYWNASDLEQFNTWTTIGPIRLHSNCILHHNDFLEVTYNYNRTYFKIIN